METENDGAYSKENSIVFCGATPKTQRLSSSSSTGTIRNKVALKPGHSLLDWIKLGHSGRDLSGVGGKYLTVTSDELARHNKRSDAWIAIKGQVYNVTPYFDFHPGGPDELLKGAGMDATHLFNEIHPWVNAESTLQKCLVGILKPSLKEGKVVRTKEGLTNLLFSKIRKRENTNSEGNGKVEIELPPSGRLSAPHFDWYQNSDSLVFILYTKRPGIGDSSPKVRVTLKDDLKAEVKVKIAKNGVVYQYALLLALKAPVLWPCSLQIMADIGKIEVSFHKEVHEIWQNIEQPGLMGPDEIGKDQEAEVSGEAIPSTGGIKAEDSLHESEDIYQPLSVENILNVNHDTKLFVLKHTKNICDFIPIGYHVKIQVNIEGVVVERFYTPVVPALHTSFWPPSLPKKEKYDGSLLPETMGNWLCLLIKSTEGGVLSPWLCDGGLKIGDTLLVSECISPTTPVNDLLVPLPFHLGRSPLLQSASQDPLDLLLLAAGTGLTPMVRIILWALQLPSSQCKKITLLFFNKTEKDIIWREQMDRLMDDCERFTAKHVLSNADTAWKGESGIIRHDLLEPYFSPGNGKSSCNVYTCICGPIPFTKAAEKILIDMNVSTKNYFSFLG